MIKTINLGFSYGHREVLKDISMEAKPGELLAVLGPNGTGKSTLFRCILGLAKGFSGQVLVDGTPIATLPPASLAKKLAYVPQSHTPSFNYSVLDMVLMGTTAQMPGFSAPGAEQVEKAHAALQKLDIAELATRGFMEISGGERQLVLVARALAQQAGTIVMDEPTSNLDYGNQLRVLARVKELAGNGLAIIQSTHNPDHALMFADRVLALKEGHVAAFGTPDDVLSADMVASLYDVPMEMRKNVARRLLYTPQASPLAANC